MPIIRLKRGTAANIEAATLQVGEPAFATDTDELYIGTATGKVKLAKSPHGNEAHSPDFLAVDGSNSPTANIDWNSRAIYKCAGVLGAPGAWGEDVAFREVNNILALADKFYTVTVNQSPTFGSISNAFRRDPTKDVRWNSSVTFPVEITIDFGATIHYFTVIGIQFISQRYASDVKIEFYHTSDSTWYTLLDISGNTSHIVFWRGGQTYVGKIRFTISGIVNYDEIAVCNLFAYASAINAAEVAGYFVPIDTVKPIAAYMSGYKWLSVATSGIMGLPRQSAVAVWNATTQSISPSSTIKLSLTDVKWDIQNEYDTTASRFTASEGGKYLVIFSVYWQTTEDQKTFGARIHKNGNLFATNEITASGSGRLVHAVASILSLAAGDYLEFYVRHEGTSSHNVYADGARCYASITKVI